MGSQSHLVHARFDQIAGFYPNKKAVIFNDQSISFAELQEQSNKFCEHLKMAGVNSGSLVIVHLERSPQYLIVILAILKAGAVYLPLDRKLPKKRKDWITDHSQASFIVSWGDKKQAPEISRTGVKVSLEIPNGGMYVMYTSGSSGYPKGVIGTHAGLLNRVDWMQKTYPIDPEEVHVMKTSISFSDHIAEAFQSLLNAATLVILKDNQVRDVFQLAENLSRYSVNRLVIVPSLLKVLLEIPKQALKHLNHLNFIFSSGETLPKHIVEMCLDRLPTARIINIYGSTEVSADVTFYEVDIQARKRVAKLFKRQELKVFSKPNKAIQDLCSNFSSVQIPHNGVLPESYLSHMKKNIIPYTVDVSHPGFVAHMTSGLAESMGDLSKMITMLNQNTVKIETSKSFTLLERQTLAKLHKLFYKFPSNFYNQHIHSPEACLGMILSGGTLANIQAMHIAKYTALLNVGATLEEIKSNGFCAELRRLGYDRAVIIGSRLMHYSIQKAGLLLGLGKNDIYTVNYDDQFKVDLSDLKRVINKCRQQNLLILAIVGIAGTTELGSIDPLEEIGAIAKKEKIFFHVDAAWGGPLIFSSRYRKLLSGIEKADSITICGHKQMYLPLGTSFLLLKNPVVAFYAAVHANYQSTLGSHDQGQFSIMGSKPAFGVFADAGLNIYGITGYQYLIEKGCQLARNFEKIIKENSAFELINYPEINLITYRYIPFELRKKKFFSKDDNKAITHATHAIQSNQFLKGETCVSYTVIRKDGTDIGVFRAVLANPTTTIQDLYAVLQDQLTIAEDMLEEPKQALLKTSVALDSSTNVPIGFPIDGCEVFIFDESLNLVEDGEIGELYVGGTVLALGYLNDKIQTDKNFISHPFEHNKKLYRTGDFGRKLDSGAIEYVGRQDQQVKVRGCRIDLIEIEQHIYAIPSISQACVLFFENELVSFYSLKAGRTLPPKKFKTSLQDVLPDAMVPSKNVMLGHFPLLASGKIDRQALYKFLKKNQNFSVNSPKEQSEPIDQILNICKTMLNLESVDMKTSFFDLGFTSLSLNVFLLKLQENVCDKLKLIDLYSYATINSLLNFIETKGLYKICEKQGKEF